MAELEQGSDGLYTLCIFGSEDTSDDEVQQIFGKFGPVVGCRRIKDNTVLFISYNERSEAEECMKHFRNHIKFRVNPARKKPQGDNADGFRNKHRGGGDNDGFRGRDRERDGGSSQWGKDRWNERGNDPPRARDFGAKGPQPARPMPPLTFDPPSAEPPKDHPKPMVAKGVIVGNIHPKTNQSMIYDLCKKAKVAPLHVAMKIISRPKVPKVHYAYVFVKNDDDVKSVCESLDNLKINSHQLIVKPATMLIEEGAALKKKN